MLIDAATLSSRLANVPRTRLLDARFAMAHPGEGLAGYVAGHVPGAAYAHLDHDLSDLTKQGQGRHPLPDEAAFAVRVGDWGIAPDDPVVVYDAADGSMAAARAWWMLTLLGHRDVSVLDGGLAAWLDAALPLVGMADAPVAEAPYPGTFDRSRIATVDEVLARLDEAPGWLLDARAGERFRGEVEPIDTRAGHVPGAVSRPLGENLANGRFKSPEVLRSEIEPLLGGRDARDVIVMCGSGVTACHLLLAMEVAGLKGARVYAGSWSEWISDPARPVATGA